MLKLYNKSFEIFETGDVIRAVLQAYNGISHDILVYLRNDDESVYYTDILVSLDSDLASGYLTEDGIFVKFLPGQAEPTEREWNMVLPAESLPLDDIGDNIAADTYSYLPFWIRIYIPGKTAAQYKSLGDLKIFYTERKVTGP